ncbi:uncharacterized protein LOC110250176 [Exaiptasia diaphana]|uniref:Uncharacterized protein n=1 Tax=Exaiptasia diaphana TaxID=2652724 RepID=A0A913XZY5_EXADI|nr:uncharacterized protein LOC110250176 [Exaiptasia diaphana]KXJ23655.1 hypothetical protein AC249_AIPGENE20562 [Exaiptasia diaphana]
MSNSRRGRVGRGPEFGRRDQSWGSPRSGSPGSPGINGSPRAGRRDRRDAGQQPPAAFSSSEHDLYVGYLEKKWEQVKSKANTEPGSVTFWGIKDHSVEPGAIFDVDRFFIERQINRKQATSSPPQPQPPHHPHHQQNMYATSTDHW